MGGGERMSPHPSSTPVTVAIAPPHVEAMPYAMLPTVEVLSEGSAAASALGKAVRLALPGIA